MSDTSHSSVGVADFRLVLGLTPLAYDFLLVSADIRALTKMENAFNWPFLILSKEEMKVT